MEKDLKFSDLLGKTLVKIEGKKGDGALIFSTDDEEKYELYHEQDCCESVSIEDINGDLDLLIGSPLTQAEEVVGGDEPDNADPEITKYADCVTWTFYKLATKKGHVVIRWFGTSNGYYSETVNFLKIRW